MQKERLQQKPTQLTTEGAPKGAVSIPEPPAQSIPTATPQLPANHILNVINALQKNQGGNTVWFTFELPSNGKCGYPKEIQLREMTTADEKTLIKEMFSSKENSILNVIRKCARFESIPDFDFENLTIFDQDYILVELSAITFPGEKDVTITDDAGHKIKIKLNKDDLVLEKVPEEMAYPFAVKIPSLGLSWYLNFMTLKRAKDIEKTVKSMTGDILQRLLVSIALTTDKIVAANGQDLIFDNFYEIVKLLDALKPADLKILIDFYNEKTSTAFGFKLTKDYYCPECGKEGKMELEALNFFRLTL